MPLARDWSGIDLRSANRIQFVLLSGPAPVQSWTNPGLGQEWNGTGPGQVREVQIQLNLHLPVPAPAPDQARSIGPGLDRNWPREAQIEFNLCFSGPIPHQSRASPGTNKFRDWSRMGSGLVLIHPRPSPGPVPVGSVPDQSRDCTETEIPDRSQSCTNPRLVPGLGQDWTGATAETRPTPTRGANLGPVPVPSRTSPGPIPVQSREKGGAPAHTCYTPAW